MSVRNHRNDLFTPNSDRRGSLSRTLARVASPAQQHPWLALTITIAIAAAASALALLPRGETHTSVDPRTRLTADYTACLLTGPDGLSDQPDAAAWAGMQQAAARTTERVTNQPIIGAQTMANAEAFIDTLAAQKCAVIIVPGLAFTIAAKGRAQIYPTIKFLILIPSTPVGRMPSNVSVVAMSTSAQITSEITKQLIADFQESR